MQENDNIQKTIFILQILNLLGKSQSFGRTNNGRMTTSDENSRLLPMVTGHLSGTDDLKTTTCNVLSNEATDWLIFCKLFK